MIELGDELGRGCFTGFENSPRSPRSRLLDYLPTTQISFSKRSGTTTRTPPVRGLADLAALELKRAEDAWDTLIAGRPLAALRARRLAESGKVVEPCWLLRFATGYYADPQSSEELLSQALVAELTPLARSTSYALADAGTQYPPKVGLLVVPDPDATTAELETALELFESYTLDEATATEFSELLTATKAAGRQAH